MPRRRTPSRRARTRGGPRPAGTRELTMPTIDAQKLGKDMLAAALGAFKEKAPAVKTYAESEFKKLAETLVTIEKARLAGEINEQQARLLLDMQKNSTRAVMLTIEGLGILTVEAAINAALAVVRDSVNAALGFALV